MGRTSNPVEAQMLTAIQATYADLDVWSDWAVEVDRPEPHSSMAKDDEIWPWHPLSELCRASMLTTIDHLKLARVAIDQRQLFPTAHFTVLRGAMVGAAQAVWLIAPRNRPERRQRGLRVLDEFYRRLRQYYEGISEEGRPAEVTAALRERIALIEQRRLGVVSLRTTTGPVVVTSVLEWAVDHVFSDPEARAEGRSLWRQGSGDAHALGWAALTRATSSTEDPTGPLSEAEAPGQLQQIAPPYMCAYYMLKEAWRLWVLRRQPYEPATCEAD